MDISKIKSIQFVPQVAQVSSEMEAKIILLNLATACINRIENNRRQKNNPKTMIPIIELIDFMDKDEETRGAVIEDVKEIIDSLIQGYGKGEAPIRYWDGVDPIVYGVSKKGWLMIEAMGYGIPENAKKWAMEPDKAPNASQQARNNATVSAKDRLDALRAKYDMSRAVENTAEAMATGKAEPTEEDVQKMIAEAEMEAEAEEEFEMPEADASDIDDETQKQTSASKELNTTPLVREESTTSIFQGVFGKRK